MSFFRKKKEHTHTNSAPGNGLASPSQAGQQLQLPTKSQLQSRSRSPQQPQQSQPVYPWSAQTPLFGQWPSPFPRYFHALSTTATTANELFLFGGRTPPDDRIRNDLYVISTRNFSTTLLQTSGDVPSPRYGHRAVATSTFLLVWGGTTDHNDSTSSNDDSLYLLNLISREWACTVVNGPGPGGRFYHSMTLMGSKLFVFGGRTPNRRFNDIWALDLNSLKWNPFWESYESAEGNDKPLPRAAHGLVSSGDRIIIFGGRGDQHYFNDAWSFNISTRKWTELQCTGSIPSPRAGHGAVLVGDVMYVFGGRTADGTCLGDLTVLNLSTQRWTALKDTGPSLCGRTGHAMASDGGRAFVLGGKLSLGTEVAEAELILVLDTKLLVYPGPDSDIVNPAETTTQHVRKSSASPPTDPFPTRGQSQHPGWIFSSSDAGVAHGAFPSEIATSEDMGRPASPQITRERNPSPSCLPFQSTGVDDNPRCVPRKDDYSDSSTERHSKPVAAGASSEKQVARLEHGRIVDLERQLSETLAVQTERDRHTARLTDQLAQKSALLDRAEANAAEAKKHARLELDKLQTKLGELTLSRDEHLRKLEQAQSALQNATSRTADADERSQPICGHETELAEVRAELEAVRLRLRDAEDGWAKSKAEVDTLRAQTAAGPSLVNTDMERMMHRLLDRMRSMEVEMSSLRGNEKSIESMECRNEG